MKKDELENIINEAFEKKKDVSEKSDKKILNAISETIELADKGIVRVAEKKKRTMVSKSMGKKSNFIKLQS